MYRPVVGLGFFLSRRTVLAIALTLCLVWAIHYRGPQGIDSVRDFAQLAGSGLGIGSGSGSGLGGGGGWLSSSGSSSSSSSSLSSQKQFVKRMLANDFYPQEYNGSAVRELCGQKAKWQQGIVISCDEIAGGIGNLKMRLLGCARYAIEAGAMLIAPVIHPRLAFDKMQASFGWDVDLPLDYVFDSEHFYATLAHDCPQLRIINETAMRDSQAAPTDNTADTDNTAEPPWPLAIPPKSEAHKLRPNTLVATSMGEHVVTEPRRWRAAFDEWVRSTILDNDALPDTTALSAAWPVRISLDEWVQFSWPNAYDGAAFKNDFGHAARIRLDIRLLAARALHRLYNRIGCRSSPHAPSTNCFLGAHIRTEADAKVEGWDSYETQLLHAREQLSHHNLSVLYVATGTASDVDRLRADLKDLRVAVNETHDESVQVLQKWDLLADADMMLMDTLTWDQMALVDMDIMLRASRFEGIWESSWAWMIALKRHEWAQEPDPYAHGVTFEDGLST
ncbi:hypothetical protein BD289DRAFT_456781 [Coniella lustricola]|uniref:GDP-fucose protein O-fucosyltransferase-domain-containing protein n=1 Tax=Coniella lustricola TaxID=2025994 RepID=A0A2T2ZUG5_9PEZI|nr:hypothetical protein BD289DRAFT_456781 [Coniella lustricola]